MGYAEVCVNSPVARRRTFSYGIPAGLDIRVGQAVLVPFGQRVLQGIVIELAVHPAVEETRDILGVAESLPLLSPARVALARWISDHYLCPLFEAVALMLPPGFERRTLIFLKANPEAGEAPTSLSGAPRETLELVRRAGRMALSELEKALGKRRAQAGISQLVARGLAVREYELVPVRITPKLELHLKLAVPPEKAAAEAGVLRKKGASRQAAALEQLAGREGPVRASEIQPPPARTVVASLAAKGLIQAEYHEVRRQPGIAPVSPKPYLNLTAAQRNAVNAVTSAMSSGTGKTFVLHGVTGSGKTEVYLRALAEAVRAGKKGLVLVPEIALTPQTIERFAERFPGRVAVLHSRLTLGEQYDEWRRIREGACDVVIGPRSALFAPQPDLGLIVLDEEHEWTYKQDTSPRYHARDAAVKLGELTGAAVLLGSATPDITTCYRARRGEFRLLELPERVTPEEGSPLPRAEIVDLRAELKSGNRGLFSRALLAAAGEAVERREQVLLFLNRRGAATFVSCRSCGFVMRCARCQVPLTYHSDEVSLVCHQCNRRQAAPYICPRCRGRNIKFFGVGTQKLEEEARRAFSRARLLRWDSDTTRGKSDADRQLLERFRAHEADILIGTQMIAKGLDLPLVTLVGVVSADTSLNFPDFRAAERTFQLLAQVAGRAGRGAAGGRVIIQTYFPEHYAIQAAARHDYPSFYEQEIAYRRELGNPPFNQMARLVFTGTSEAACLREAEKMTRQLVLEMDSRGLAGISLIGPAPAFIHRLRGRWRWQIVLRGPELSGFLGGITLPRGWTLDIDPVGLV